jgi:hypothetical protein
MWIFLNERRLLWEFGFLNQQKKPYKADRAILSVGPDIPFENMTCNACLHKYT